MKKARKGYLKGMVKDNTRSKYPDDSYYHLENFRVVTDEGNSTGSLENEKGHILGFEIPNVPAATYQNNTATYNIPAQNNLAIIGWGTINDTVIVITTNETSKTPTDSIGQVWAFEFDEVTGEVIGALPGNVLDVNTHLKYNNKLNLSSYYRIARIIGRYENSRIQRIYWTDNYNFVRTLNIADPNSLNIEPSLLDLSPGTNLSQPVIWDVGNGALPAGTSIQFTYRLLSNSGAQSLFAPCTPIVPLNATGYGVAIIEAFNGDGTQNQLTRSVTIKIDGIDTNFDVIEYVAILYTAFGVATAYKFDEGQVPISGSVEKVCSSLATAEIIPLVELNTLSSGFEVAKDIEVKDNLLIAANTKSSDFDLDFDTRCYRFNVNRQARLIDSTSGDSLTINGSNLQYITDSGVSGTWDQIPEEHDAFNPYNDDSTGPAIWATNQYKYQADGVTIGGEGPNIKYKFVTKSLLATNNLEAMYSGAHIGVSKGAVNATPDFTGILNPDGSQQVYNMANQFYNFASFTNHAYFAGHARGETYRYGITFYNKKGTVSFVKWIADIRIPEVTEGFPIQDNNGPFAASSNGELLPWLHTLGIEFEINTASIADQISGFSIVRVLRNEANKTRLGSGILMFFHTHFPRAQYGAEDLWVRWVEGNNDAPASQFNVGSLPNDTTSDLEYFGLPAEKKLVVNTLPFWGLENLVAADAPAKRALTHLVSPLGHITPVIHKEGDYLRSSGYYKTRARLYGDHYPGGLNFNEHAVGFHYKLNSFHTYAPGDSQMFKVRHAESLTIGEHKGGGTLQTLIATDVVANDRLSNVSFSVNSGSSYQTNTPFAMGDRKLAMLLDTNADPAKPWLIPAQNMAVYGNNSANVIPTFNPLPAGALQRESTEVYFKQVHYSRHLPDQYGGRTYEDRSTVIYTYIGHFQPSVQGITTFTNQVYLGDTYVNYFDKEILMPYQDAEVVPNNNWNEPESDKNRISVAVCCPVESPINTEFRPTTQWAKSRTQHTLRSSTYTYDFNATDFNFAYANYDFVNTRYFPKDFLLKPVEEHPNRIWASQNKVNGELVDSWRNFQVNNFIEVNGVLGPINRIINWRESLYYYQDRGIGSVSINERSIVTDNSGQEVVLGTGGILSDFRYFSTETGSFHQFGIAATSNGIYHYDARLKKIYAFNGQQMSPLSDVKGMSSFFDNAVNGKILKEDRTLTSLDTGPIGVEAIPDFRYNRVLFTFLSPDNVRTLELNSSYSEGDIIYDSGIYYLVGRDFTTGNRFINLANFNRVSPLDTGNFGFTISYNELLQSFESFYSFVPSTYMQYGRRLLSKSPFEKNKGFIHNVGEFCRYYNQKYYPSKLETTLGEGGDFTKVFNNLEYYGQVTQNGTDVPLESFHKMRLYNDYQDTGDINLTSSNLRRRMRTWRYTIPRDNSGTKARLRNQWLNLQLEYENSANKKHIVHDIIYSYTPVAF